MYRKLENVMKSRANPELTFLNTSASVHSESSWLKRPLESNAPSRVFREIESNNDPPPPPSRDTSDRHHDLLPSPGDRDNISARRKEKKEGKKPRQKDVSPSTIH